MKKFIAVLMIAFALFCSINGHTQRTPEDLSIIDDNGNPKEFTGKVTISVGGGQPDTKIKTTSNVVKGTINIL